mgnify:CR=1 FL=1
MKILVTGAGGFLGKELVNQLKGDHDLYCLARSIKPDLPQDPHIHWIEMDLSAGLDLSKLPEKIDGIVHLAQSNGYRNFPAEADDVFAVNIALTQALCNYGVKAGISRMVLASTGTVYEPFIGVMAEANAVRPSGYYGASKLAAELISEAYSAQFSVCNMRIFFLYGPGQENMLIARLIENVKKGNKVSLPKDGEGLIFVPTFVGDTASAFKSALEDAWNGVYNIASPHQISLGGLLRTISKATGKPLNLELTEASSPAPIVPDLDKIGEILNLDQFLTPEQGIRKSI